jgi:hypothetical protein
MLGKRSCMKNKKSKMNKKKDGRKSNDKLLFFKISDDQSIKHGK